MTDENTTEIAAAETANQNQVAANSTIETHGLAHLEAEFSEWLDVAERDAGEILAWFAGKIAPVDEAGSEVESDPTSEPAAA